MRANPFFEALKDMAYLARYGHQQISIGSARERTLLAIAVEQLVKDQNKAGGVEAGD